ncbi:protein Jade-1 isoform X1 [Synchiropus splendidus]|uniref:protein Jade-1 isoform X1 n=1 Tax=Synchiropus splendidus TaxID=270530 RepID=UPI00237E1BAD|nr:protein Jade-1 isoform X1 [Synchiropus splendidus]XP_053701888.1 protein Jade-1 isoform X1 [Synchiropus splendidus]
MKRIRHPSSSDDSDNGRKKKNCKLKSKSKRKAIRRQCNSTCWSQNSSQPRRGTGQKPSEVFRTDLITAMKIHDSCQLNPEDFCVLADPWRQEWEKGVQVPVSPQSIPQPVARVLAEKEKEVMFTRPKKLIRTSGTEALGYVDIRTLAEGMCRYDLNEEDVAWLHIINQEFAKMALPQLDEISMERVMEEFERCCHENMTHAMETEEGLGIEYDEDVVCDVCQSPDGEDNNEMVFCDKCNICVHQACYGIQKVPKGSWLCRICALGIVPKCQLCPKKGGAMKPTRSGTKWVHVSCALWIPEVSIGNPEKMEPITNVSHIPSNRWALICCLCKEKTGACIQCSAKNCRTAFHVTCGLHASLDMSTILTEEDEVKFKSFCPKHSGLEGAESKEQDEDEEEDDCVKEQTGKRKGRVREEQGASCSSSSLLLQPSQPRTSSEQEKQVNLRKLKLQEMEEEFYQFVQVETVARELKVAPEAVDFLYQYWKLKRKANFNQPLLTPKKDEEESLARREHEVLLRRLQLFTHLRQDLERVRNLTYMVTRREKLKRSICRVQEQIFQHQVRLLDQELLRGNPSSKGLEKLASHDSSTSQGSQSRWGHSGLKTKRSFKKEKRKNQDKMVSPSQHSEEADPKIQLQSLNRESKQDMLRTSVLNRRKKESEQQRMESVNGQWRHKLAAGNLEKSVSVRLVDIKHSDFQGRCVNGRASQQAPSSVDLNTPISKPQCEVVNGCLRKSAHANGSHLSHSGHLKGWGKFRIPKRSERSAKELLRPLTNTPEPSQPRTRLRAAPDHDGYDSKSAVEPCLKRCHSHQLRGDSALTRRYVSDIIRRGVFAS